MTEPNFTILDDGRAVAVAATMSRNRVRLSADTLQNALGWELKPQGLCRNDRCVAITGQADLVTDDGVDLAGVAALLDRPLALDVDARAACFGAAAADRAARLASLEAPDFTLPDLAGRRYTLSDYRGKKVLLVAYASW